MKLCFVDVKFNGEVSLSREAIKALEPYKKVGFFTTTQFQFGSDEVITQLEQAGHEVITSQPERTNAPRQTLGCDVYHGNLHLPTEPEVLLYVGDGKFHPRALLFHEHDAATNRPVIQYDPVQRKTEVLTQELIEPVLDRQLKNMKRFLVAERVGVVVTTKHGQAHKHYFEKLRQAFPQKRFYLFFTDEISFAEMENFPFISAWINTACPRIGMEDILNTEKAILNAEEALSLKE